MHCEVWSLRAGRGEAEEDHEACDVQSSLDCLWSAVHANIIFWSMQEQKWIYSCMCLIMACQIANRWLWTMHCKKKSIHGFKHHRHKDVMTTNDAPWLMSTCCWLVQCYDSDVIMNAMVSHITSVSMVCSTVCSGTDQRKHQSSASLAFMRGIHWWPVDSPHKGPVNQSINQSNPVLLKERVRIPRTCRAGGAAMLWRRLPLDGVGSCRLFFTDDLHDNLSWVPASDKPHTFKSCFTHSSQVFFGRPGPFLPGTGLDLTLFISPLERMTCPNHLSRRSRTRMARSHIPSLACSSSIDGSSDGLTPQIQRIIARSLRHSRWRAAEVMGQVSVPCNIELRTLELNRRPLRSKGTGLDVSKGRFSRNLPQAHLHLAVAAAMQPVTRKMFPFDDVIM